MKKYTYCGKEYPDEAEICERDGERLVDPTAPRPEQNLVGIRLKETIEKILF
jgi:hypothetical protein